MTLFSLIFHNLTRKKSRLLLTCLSVSIAFYLFSSVAAIDNALNRSVANVNQQRLITRHKISITRSLPINYQQKITKIPNVAAVSYASWFGGFFQDQSDQLSILAVDSQQYFSMYNEYKMPAAQLTNWQHNRIGIAVSEKIARQHGWKLGDHLPLKSSLWMTKAGDFTWYFEIAAIYHGSNATTNTKNIFFHHNYFDENRAYGRYGVTWFSVLLVPNANVQHVSNQIDKLFVNSPEATRTDTEQAFLAERTQQFVDLTSLLKVVVVAVFFTLLLIVSNTLMLTTRERQSEFAIMRTLGFSTATLATILFLEALITIGIGAFIGLLLAFTSISILQQLLAEFLPAIAIGIQQCGLLVLITIATAIVVSAIPTWSLYHNTIVNSLEGNNA